MEAQIIALQLVIREMAGYADAVGEDVDELIGEVFGEDGGGGGEAAGGQVEREMGWEKR